MNATDEIETGLCFELDASLSAGQRSDLWDTCKTSCMPFLSIRSGTSVESNTWPVVKLEGQAMMPQTRYQEELETLLFVISQLGLSDKIKASGTL